MKRRIKYNILLICLFLALNPVFAYAASKETDLSDSYEDYSSTKAQLYLEENASSIIEVLHNNAETFNLESGPAENFSFGRPFIIYLFEEKQDEIYYVPVIDNSTQKIVVVVGLMNTSNGYTFDMQASYVPYLNEIDYIHTDAIVYKYGNSLYFETPEVVVKSNKNDVMPPSSDEEVNAFLNGSFEDKRNKVIAKAKSMQADSYSVSISWTSPFATIMHYFRNRTD